MAHRELPAQYRYYEIPPDSHVLALFAVEWLHLQKHGDAPHFHNLMEIGYCHEGQGDLMYGSAIFPYGDGTTIVAPANYPHGTFANPAVKNRWEYIMVDVEGFLKEVYPEGSDMPWRLATRVNTDALHLPPGEYPDVARLTLEILDACRRRGDLYREAQKGLVLTLLVEIARAHQNPLESAAGDIPGTAVLHRALEYIGEQYPYKIRIGELADACHISESHFRRLFTQCMHMTPVAYINHVRIQAACRMLTATGEAVSDVAMKCGFPTLSTFNRTFHEITGKSPRQWRASLPKTRPVERFAEI